MYFLYWAAADHILIDPSCPIYWHFTERINENQIQLTDFMKKNFLHESFSRSSLKIKKINETETF